MKNACPFKFLHHVTSDAIFSHVLFFLYVPCPSFLETNMLLWENALIYYFSVLKTLFYGRGLNTQIIQKTISTIQPKAGNRLVCRETSTVNAA